MPAAIATAGGPNVQHARCPAPATQRPARAVIGVCPGSRPTAALSPIATGPGRPGGLRAAPSRGARPMYPPIGRAMTSPWFSAAALQASAAAARPGLGTSTARREVTVATAGAAAITRSTGGPRPGFGMPSLRRNVCPHFFISGARGAIPIQAPHLLKALVRQEANVSRCQVRGGVHLDQGYVGDVCVSARFNQCVFYEDELSR
jgi:hypothetical protein